MSARIHDLLGIRYLLGGTDPRVGVDCLWTVRQFAQRFFEDFDPLELPMTADEEEAAVAGVSDGSSRWKIIGTTSFAACEIGDLVFGSKDGDPPSVAIVVDKPGRLALTANRLRGVHLIPISRLTATKFVLRRDA